MISIRKILSEIPMCPGDRIVSATTYHDEIIVITEQGAVFKIIMDDLT